MTQGTSTVQANQTNRAAPIIKLQTIPPYSQDRSSHSSFGANADFATPSDVISVKLVPKTPNNKPLIEQPAHNGYEKRKRRLRGDSMAYPSRRTQISQRPRPAMPVRTTTEERAQPNCSEHSALHCQRAP